MFSRTFFLAVLSGASQRECLPPGQERPRGGSLLLQWGKGISPSCMKLRRACGGDPGGAAPCAGHAGGAQAGSPASWAVSIAGRAGERADPGMAERPSSQPAAARSALTLLGHASLCVLHGTCQRNCWLQKTKQG